MGAADPLWQWDVHSDRIVLSPEAANLLQGGAGNGYRGECGAFCDGLADDRQESVRQLFGSLRRSSFDNSRRSCQTVGGTSHHALGHRCWAIFYAPAGRGPDQAGRQGLVA